jgi:hypothetical protein
VIILLDIDGVMVPAASWKTPELLNDGFPGFSTNAVRGLNKILSTTNASILLTSTHKDNYTLKAWKDIFAKRGIHPKKITTLKTPTGGHSRKEDVLDWLQKRKKQNKFVIIDDDKSLNALPPEFKDKVILTSPLIGLNESLADEAIKALQNQTK